MIGEIVLFVVLGVALVGLLIWFRRLEGVRLRQSTKEALSPTLREEIEKEREEALGRKRQFEEVMKKAYEDHHPTHHSDH